VLSLERVMHCEDRHLLAGHMALIFRDYQTAQDLFLSSARPVAALEMRRDLLHWEQALKLAQTLEPALLCDISVQASAALRGAAFAAAAGGCWRLLLAAAAGGCCCCCCCCCRLTPPLFFHLSPSPSLPPQYAQQLEFKQDYDIALRMYEQALESITMGDTDPVKGELHRPHCQAGIARCTLHQGNLTRGLEAVRNCDDTKLYRECGAICEGLKQLSDAAELYVNDAAAAAATTTEPRVLPLQL
jgi:WD repeat-containing protein 19